MGSVAKEILRRQLWQVAEFAGLEILTYTILSNHFHVLVRVPKAKPVSDDELLRRFRVLYPKPTRYEAARMEVISPMLLENGPDAAAWRRRQLSLMNDVSQFMKLVKERFSIWYNKRHNRFGPVWSDRFKSILIESHGGAITSVAAYIDLNCVRAGIVSDPKDYRFCGYSEAVAGQLQARRGLQSIVGQETWTDVQASYRQMIFGTGAAPREGKAAISPEKLRQVISEGGCLPLPEVLRCRIRYFSHGAVLGRREFVQFHLAQYRQRNGCGERMAPRTLPNVTDWGGMVGMRAIRGAIFG